MSSCFDKCLLIKIQIFLARQVSNHPGACQVLCDDGSWDGDGDEDTCHHCLHSNEDERHTYFYNLLRGVAGSELVIREDMALAAIRAGSAEEFSPDEMQQLLRRCDLRGGV